MRRLQLVFCGGFGVVVVHVVVSKFLIRMQNFVTDFDFI